jgi:hypothetical protein
LKSFFEYLLSLAFNHILEISRLNIQMKDLFLLNIMNRLCLCVVMSIELLNKVEDSFAFLYVHNIAFNGSIIESDIDQHYNRHSYKIDWNITRDNRFTFHQAYVIYMGTDTS